MQEYFSAITDTNKWSSEINEIFKRNTFSKQFIDSFHTTWTVSGHQIRKQINNDRKLAKLLRLVLPKYSEKDLLLYRGENIERWEERQIGFCWTTNKETARMFGSGLNSMPSGGLLISCNCNKSWIISGPSAHSKYLGESEYTVEPSLLKNIKVLSEYTEIYK